MHQLLHLVIIDSDRQTRATIEELVRPFSDRIRLGGSTDNLNDGLRAIQNSGPWIVILGVTDLDIGAEQIRTLLSHHPKLTVFVATHEKNPDWILRLMRAGAVEYLLKPITRADLFEALQKAGKHLFAPSTDEPGVDGKITAVYNPVGGMGTTTIAVNLAAAIAKETDKVALVDLNLFSGDVATFLDVSPKYTLSSVTSNLARLDASFLLSVMAQHSCGVYLLSEPLEVEESLNITTEQIQQVMALLRQVFTHTIIDTGGNLFGTNEMVFREADQVLFNTVLNLPALQNAKRYLAAMDKHGIGREKVKIIVNRYLSRADIKVPDAEKVLDRRVFLTIPNEYGDVIDSINRGIPVVSLSPRSAVSKALVELATRLKVKAT